MRVDRKTYGLRPRLWLLIYFYLPSAVFILQVLLGPSKQLKQTIQIEHSIFTDAIMATGRRQISFLFTSVAEDLNSGLPWNQGSRTVGQSGIRTQDRWIASPRRWPLGHTASSRHVLTLTQRHRLCLLQQVRDNKTCLCCALLKYSVEQALTLLVLAGDLVVEGEGWGEA